MPPWAGRAAPTPAGATPGAGRHGADAVSRDPGRAAVVGLHAHVPPDRPSAATLGEERAGSATVIDPDGLAVTVGYLVLEAARIEVTLEDGRRTTARVVGHDFESGLALIRLDPGGAPYPAARSASPRPSRPGSRWRSSASAPRAPRRASWRG